MLIPKGTYVRVRNHILKPENRVENIPDDTSNVPLKSWVKGHLTHEAELYEAAEIITETGRKVQGIVKEVEPKPRHDFGDFVPEIMKMRHQILNEVWGNDDE